MGQELLEKLNAEFTFQTDKFQDEERRCKSIYGHWSFLLDLEEKCKSENGLDIGAFKAQMEMLRPYIVSKEPKSDNVCLMNFLSYQ